ncbi:SBBP repeat-containing protein [Polyangium aurulentum]|uniref:SBBP repeat-containing protein n=1 Tax=Polyangium aurulentum TaxID=2567896 RepID=UPI0010AE3AE6|nr:SBBP repeat-containing protein [Polyangium aurulentum]UQA57845.1 SBBP repeat-containing protein [Polyangium aurulentum]
MRIHVQAAIPLVLVVGLLGGCAPELRDPPAAWKEGPIGDMHAETAVRFGGAGTRVLSSIAVRPSGESLLAGHFQGQVDIGLGATPSTGSEDLMLVRLDPTGAPKSLIHAGGTGVARVRAVAARSDGSAVLAGDFTGGFDLGATKLESAGGWDVFLATLGADDEISFAQRFGDPGEQTATCMGLGEDGQIVVAGSLSGTIDLGEDELESLGEHDVFQQAKAVAVDSSGVVVVGEFEGELQVGDESLKSAGGRDVFVIALGRAGELRWVQRLGDAGDDEAAGVIVDSEGNTFVAGSFTGSVGRGGAVAVVEPEAERAAFVAVIDATGELVRVRGFGQTGVTTARAIASKPGIGALVAVDFTGHVEMGDRGYDSAGAEDLLVFDIDKALRVHRAGSFGDPYPQRAIAAAVDGKGDTLLIGDFMGTLSTAAGSIQSLEGDEPFWMRIQ